MREYVTKIWPGNALGEAFARTFPFVWLGVSVENQHWADVRIPVLLDTPAAVRFLSCEPLLGPLDLHGSRWLFRRDALPATFGNPSIDWVIAGGESAGPTKRALVERWQEGIGPDAGWEWVPKAQSLLWIQNIRDQCVAAGVPFFFKQWRS